MGKIRLYIDHGFAPGQPVPLDAAQAHYLGGVMRQPVGAEIAVFNGRDGEWSARLQSLGKRGGELALIAPAAPQVDPPDVWLLFAPIKKARTDFIVEKAAELGAARIQPLQTDHSNTERIARERLQAHAVEAAEQCGGTFVPPVADLVALPRLLAGWDPARRILWADEALADAQAESPVQVLQGLPRGPWAILIGPEGGWSGAERQRLGGLDFVRRISLGPRVLRADSAAVAALTLWQAVLGDWNPPRDK
ncbi:MAG TPA: 16S rRNA (uracil(1498)-N(3))-methyltransferase [Paracoccus solventivorans]|uniref:Ribosomal RNA small subunit methyltransferase E n=1 Tax=Paracoccus solventivorans TaxID=53463 RepID=A0A832PKZ1_9RHOB|nr:16S rRNA (uracil(1498)-N(3))-methyltransferase [Paracoccus solventivorans]HHW33484.1 16S rRNA (uracil(1498)-N(3))-methyltransferase [Paracoccus solventivorans]